MNIYITILIMCTSTYLIRMIPFTLFRKKIKSRFLYSLFYYMPYAILSSMVFPSVLYCTSNIYSALIASVVAIVLSVVKIPMAVVSIMSAGVVFIIEQAPFSYFSGL